MALDLPESESQTPDGVPLGWEAPWEKPQMMVVEEREGMMKSPRGCVREGVGCKFWCVRLTIICISVN